jgi:hypothetical protein
MISRYTQNTHHWLRNALLKPLVDETDNVLVVDWWKDIVYECDDVWDGKTFNNFSSEKFLNKIAEYDFVFIVFLEVMEPGKNSLEVRFRHRMLGDLIKKLNEMPSINFITFSESSFFGNEIEPSRTFSVPWFYGAFYTGGIIHSPGFTPDIEYVDKDYTFSMLLGKKDGFGSRDMLFDIFKDRTDIYKTNYSDNNYKAISDKHLEESFLVKYFSNQNVDSDYLQTFTRIEVPYEFDNDIFIDGYDKPVISHIVPEKVYNNAHFDITSETHPQSNSITGWASEKTAKPLSCGRFFIWLNVPNTSSYLKKFGYELDSYALNDYDKEVNNDNRFWKIVELIEELNNTNYVKKVYEDTKEARIHNMQVAKDGQKNTLSNLQEWIKERLSTKI